MYAVSLQTSCRYVSCSHFVFDWFWTKVNRRLIWLECANFARLPSCIISVVCAINIKLHNSGIAGKCPHTECHCRWCQSIDLTILVTSDILLCRFALSVLQWLLASAWVHCSCTITVFHRRLFISERRRKLLCLGWAVTYQPSPVINFKCQSYPHVGYIMIVILSRHENDGMSSDIIDDSHCMTLATR